MADKRTPRKSARQLTLNINSARQTLIDFIDDEKTKQRFREALEKYDNCWQDKLNMKEIQSNLFFSDVTFPNENEASGRESEDLKEVIAKEIKALEARFENMMTEVKVMNKTAVVDGLSDLFKALDTSNERKKQLEDENQKFRDIVKTFIDMAPARHRRNL